MSDLYGTSETGKDEWAIGVTRQPVTTLLTRNTSVPVHWLTAPEGRFFADPFVVTRGAVSYIFFEDYNYEESKGRISLIETEDFSTFSPARAVLDLPFHLSYPYVFSHDGRWYCIPEQYQSGEVALYEAESFPDRWIKRASLLTDFPGVDPTVFQHAGRWWMFVTNFKNDDATHLYLFHADSLFGPWTPHARNPVKSAQSMVRPAGKPFYLKDALLRPAQDCSSTYGGHIGLYRIRTLSTTAFEECLVGEIEPQQEWPFAAGLHTINSTGDITVIDAKRRLAVRKQFGKVLRKKVRTAFVGRERH
jgi:Glycosyl hydrolases family 43.